MVRPGPRTSHAASRRSAPVPRNPAGGDAVDGSGPYGAPSAAITPRPSAIGTTSPGKSIGHAVAAASRWPGWDRNHCSVAAPATARPDAPRTSWCSPGSSLDDPTPAPEDRRHDSDVPDAGPGEHSTPTDRPPRASAAAGPKWLQ